MNLYPQVMIWSVIGGNGKGVFHCRLYLNFTPVRGLSVVMRWNTFKQFNVVFGRYKSFTKISNQPTIKGEFFLGILVL